MEQQHTADNDAGCWAPDHNGTMRTTHPHFEGRCVREPMDADFRERLDAYLAGGWDAWHEVKRAQLSRVIPPGKTD